MVACYERMVNAIDFSLLLFHHQKIAPKAAEFVFLVPLYRVRGQWERACFNAFKQLQGRKFSSRVKFFDVRVCVCVCVCAYEVVRVCSGLDLCMPCPLMYGIRLCAILLD
jgi:hypothetical protein